MICCLLLFLVTPAFGDDIPLFKKIVEENSKINTIDAEIVQYIYTPEHYREIFKGRYRADSNYRFRIDYTFPQKQIIMNNGGRLIWYYPTEKILYRVSKGDSISHQSNINPLREYEKNFDKQYEVNYRGRNLYGFFKMAHQFVIRDKKRGLITDIKVDTKKMVILTKIVKGRDGIEIMKEQYHGYKKIGNIYFPSRIEVYARTANGITSNITEYNNVQLNYAITDQVFHIDFPKDIRIKYLH
ncbi:MAG: outer-membrane lipoprotein carrier protein LolA [Spirochaetota bacterium]|nr:outer-membrane lipoprotein carrier protein LolA [Spirochaetota bacterium]